jgi:F-type H+-transporting ATPase subunit b
MGEILSRLGQLFVQSTPTVLFVFLLLVILESLFFRPISSVLKRREEATSGALARARERAAVAEAKSREYEAAFQAARQEVYRWRQAERHAALSQREDDLKRVREQSESLLRDVEASLAAQMEAAMQELSRASQSLALEITHMVLGNALSSDGEGSGGH